MPVHLEVPGEPFLVACVVVLLLLEAEPARCQRHQHVVGHFDVTDPVSIYHTIDTYCK